MFIIGNPLYEGAKALGIKFRSGSTEASPASYNTFLWDEAGTLAGLSDALQDDLDVATQILYRLFYH
jgi:hypothetical protein